MKDLFNKLMNKVSAELSSAQLGVNALVDDERGDTNFISIAIILIVVIVIAIIFITFGEEIGGRFQNSINDLFNAL